MNILIHFAYYYNTYSIKNLRILESYNLRTVGPGTCSVNLVQKMLQGLLEQFTVPGEKHNGFSCSDSSPIPYAYGPPWA